MDPQRAERHLWLAAERALRQASGYLDGAADDDAAQPGLTRAAPLVGPVPAERVIRDSMAGVRDVADALTEVGAVGQEVAAGILVQLAQALSVRSPGGAGTLPRDVYRLVQGHRQTAAGPAGAGGPAPPAELRVVPAGRLARLPAGGVPSDLYLMAAVVTPGMTALSMSMRTRWPTNPANVQEFPPGADGADPSGLTAIDEHGAAYRLSFSGAPGPHDWDGYLDVQPAPPAGITWLDVMAGADVVARVDLGAVPPSAEVATEPYRTSPGERLLTRIAERLLAGRAYGPAPAVENLGEMVAALIAAGALPGHSPVPGQLAALCEFLGRGDHGIAAGTGADLPGPWADVLGVYDRDRQPPIRSGFVVPRPPPSAQTAVAPAAAVFPEIDGVRFAVAGLQAAWNRNHLYVVATGLTPPDPHLDFWEVDTGFSWWARGRAGRWHLASVSRSDAGADGETRLSLNVSPPVGPDTDHIELVVTGRSARARAQVPLRWSVLPA